MCVNKLSLNPSKTESFLIGSRSQLARRNSLCIKLCGQVIKHKETVKYLGVTLDQQLKWDVHINVLCSKLFKPSPLLSKRNLFKIIVQFSHSSII